jgi:putative flippase GtrA
MRELITAFLRREPCRYLVVSVICAGLNIGLVWWFGASGIQWLAAIVLAFPAVNGTAYLLHTRWTFMVRISWMSFGRYILAMAVNFPIFTLMIGGLCGLAGLPAGPGTAIATVMMFVWNYIASRWAIVPAPPSFGPAAWAETRGSTP